MGERQSRRRERLNEWLIATGIGSVTDLLRDIALIVGDFVVWLEHEWAPLPDRLRLFGIECGCPKFPSRTVSLCSCRTWECQHFCSALTIEESGAAEFSINIKSSVRWWLGIIWSSDDDGLQAPEVSFLDRVPVRDTIKYVSNAYACLINYAGMLLNYDHSSRVFTQLDSGLDNFTGSDAVVRVKLLDDVVEFSVIGFESRTIAMTHSRIKHLQARPFVQFDSATPLGGPNRWYQTQNSPRTNSLAIISTPLAHHS
jgi:hypothetical protein